VLVELYTPLVSVFPPRLAAIVSVGSRLIPSVNAAVRSPCASATISSAAWYSVPVVSTREWPVYVGVG
jgi:hypothetical protein